MHTTVGTPTLPSINMADTVTNMVYVYVILSSVQKKKQP